MNSVRARSELRLILSKPRHQRTMREQIELERKQRDDAFRHAVLLACVFGALIVSGLIR